MCADNLYILEGSQHIQKKKNTESRYRICPVVTENGPFEQPTVGISETSIQLLVTFATSLSY